MSFTVPANLRSIRVMEEIGMSRDTNGDFAHPKIAGKSQVVSTYFVPQAKRRDVMKNFLSKPASIVCA